MDLSIHNAVLKWGSRTVNIGIDNGLISKISGDPIPEVDKAINANGNLIGQLVKKTLVRKVQLKVCQKYP